ncbi:proteasome subunit beta type-5, partial [Tachysurus ichikawai]
MALANLLKSECADFEQPFSFGCGFNDTNLGFGEPSGDRLNFAVKPFEGEEDGIERQIEFLHGTTTLAFK